MTAAGPVAALAGGLAALAGTILLPFHGRGGLGGWIAGLFLLAGLALAFASIDLGSRAPRSEPERGDRTRSWAALGAGGFAIGGAGLVADVIERPIVAAEIAGVLAVAAWWLQCGRALRRGSARAFGTVSLALAAFALCAIVLQLTWNAAEGAVPARFAYVLWAPWGIGLAAALRRDRTPFGTR